ncbi:MAG: hypothetical protein F6K26_28360 [Moorea sp. SIO2I5]|nr:hypothetical protein [Moorena sp. SIO2I5]
MDKVADGGLVVILPESVSRAIKLIEARNPLPDNGLKTTGADNQDELKPSVVN